jgi:uncharacterized protein YutE (UPF0331/DUF86 family)
MVRPEVARKKIARAIAWVNDADGILSRPQDEFVADLRGRDLAAFYLFLAIQECIDLAAHWVADSGWSPPDDAASTFDVMSDRGVIARQVADGMRSATGLRNRIAHGYALLDHRRLHTESREGVETLRTFLDSVSRKLEDPDEEA